MSVLNWSEKSVYCPLCKFGSAILKYTKTDHLMLRCDDCMLLLFANSPDSQNALLRLCKLKATERYYPDTNYDNF